MQKPGEEPLRPSEDGSEPRHHSTGFLFRKSPVPLPGAARPAGCPDTGHRRLPRSPQPRAESGPISPAQTVATPALPRLSSRRAGGRDAAAAPGTRRGATPRLKVAGAPEHRRGSTPQTAALPPGRRSPTGGGAGKGPRPGRAPSAASAQPYLSRHRPTAAALCPSPAPSHKMAAAERRAQPPRAAWIGYTPPHPSQRAGSLRPRASGWLRSRLAASACPFPFARCTASGWLVVRHACGSRSRSPIPGSPPAAARGPAAAREGRRGPERRRPGQVRPLRAELPPCLVQAWPVQPAELPAVEGVSVAQRDL